MTFVSTAWQTIKDHPIIVVCSAFGSGCIVAYTVTQLFFVAPLKERVEQRSRDSTIVEQRYPVLLRQSEMLRVRAESLTVWNTRHSTLIAQRDTNLARWQAYAHGLARRLGTASQDAVILAEIRRLETQKQGIEEHIQRRSQAWAYGNTHAISPTNQAFIQQLMRQANNLQERILGLESKLLQ